MALNVLCIWRDKRALHCLIPHCLHVTVHVHIGGLRALMGPPRPVEPLEPPLEHPPHEGPEGSEGPAAAGAWRERTGCGRALHPLEDRQEKDQEGCLPSPSTLEARGAAHQSPPGPSNTRTRSEGPRGATSTAGHQGWSRGAPRTMARHRWSIPCFSACRTALGLS